MPWLLVVYVSLRWCGLRRLYGFEDFKLSENALLRVRTAEIFSGVLCSIVNVQIAVVVDTNALVEDAVTNVNIADNAVTESKIAPNSVSTDQLAPGAVTGEKIQEGSVQLESFVSDLQSQVRVICHIGMYALPTKCKCVF